MSLFIKVYVGSRDNNILVAESHAYNVSDLADVSNYGFRSKEPGASHLGIPASDVKGEVKNHNRNQTVWSLVQKIAAETVKKVPNE